MEYNQHDAVLLRIRHCQTWQIFFDYELKPHSLGLSTASQQISCVFCMMTEVPGLNGG